MSKKDIDARTNRWIRDYGRAIIYIEPGPFTRSFGYTVGLTLAGHPEFMVRGLNFEDTCQMLNGFADSVLVDKERFGQGHTSRWKDGRILLFSVLTRGLSSLVVDAIARYGSRVRVLEISFLGNDPDAQNPIEILNAWKN